MQIQSVFLCALLVQVATFAFAQSQPPTRFPVISSDISLPDRDVQRILEEAQKQDWVEFGREYKEKQSSLPSPAISVPQPQEYSDAVVLYLKEVEFSPSEVLSKNELNEAVKEFLNEELRGKELTKLLMTVNELYRKKGYVVCQAVLKPQRISDGKLFISLIEGKTGEVNVSFETENESSDTRSSYIARAFNLPSGEVANYEKMVNDLIRFNMTNDVQLSIDMKAGEKEQTTDYTVLVREPAPRMFNVFADSAGSTSTGRYRLGAGFIERSLLGWRDKLQLVALGTRGSGSFMGSYSVPLNSYGVRLSATYSYGAVKVVDGPSEDFDVKGASQYFALRLDYPFYVTSNSKLSGYIQGVRQTSKTRIYHALDISDTSVKSLMAGFEEMMYGKGLALYSHGQYVESWAKNYTFDSASRYRRLIGNINWEQRIGSRYGYSVNIEGQKYLGGGDMVSGSYFYLGSSSGVRGYENDALSAYSGGWVNFEQKLYFDDQESNVFVFFDVGKLGGKSSYAQKTLASVGPGVTWRPWNWLSSSATIAFPLRRKVAEERADKARLDFVINAVW